MRVEWDQDALNTAARGGSKGLLETRTQAKQLVEKEVEVSFFLFLCFVGGIAEAVVREDI